MSSGSLGEPFKESNEKDDLPLGCIGKSIPLFRGRSGGVGEGRSVEGSGPGEVDSVGLDNVSYKGGHGDASVLDFRVAEECDGFVVGASPDGGG